MEGVSQRGQTEPDAGGESFDVPPSVLDFERPQYLLDVSVRKVGTIPTKRHAGQFVRSSGRAPNSSSAVLYERQVVLSLSAFEISMVRNGTGGTEY